MSDDDRRRWDEKHRQAQARAVVGLPEVFAPYEDLFPHTGSALEVACGRGGASVWLALRGVTVLGVDVSPVAVSAARDLAAAQGVADRCRFEVLDLDDGLPPGDAVDVLLCHRFRDRRLYPAMTARLAPGGMLALSVLSEVGASSGPFRAPRGELREAFDDLEVIADGEGDGVAWLVASSPRRVR
jgi:SAM-dependent methyltransferase